MTPATLISRTPRLALIALAAIMLLPGLGSLPLIDRDEPRFAHATVEMIYRDEWVVPYFNDDYRFDKPPLTYWWMRAHFAVFGVNEFAARLHSTVATLLCALLIFGFARRLGCDATRAFLAGAGWLTCVQVLVHSRMAVADMPLLLFLILTMRALWELVYRDPARPFSKCFSDPWFYVLGLSMGAGFLAKGPLAQFIPLLAILLWGLLNRFRKRPSPNFARLLLYFLASAPIWFGMMAAWGIPALLATDGAFFDIGIGRHVVERGTSAFNDRFFIPGVYYLVVMIPFLLPWSARLPDAFRTAWNDDRQAGSFLLAWFLSPFLVFSFYATQLPHYVLPGYPAFFLLLFRGETSQPAGKWTRAIAVLCLALPIGGALFFLVCSFLIPGGAEISILRSFFLWAAAGLVFIAAATWFAMKRQPLRVLGVGVLGAALIIPISRVAREMHVTLRLKDALADRHFDARASWKFNEPSLVWYFDKGRGDFRWEKWSPTDKLPDSDNLLMVLEHRLWRIDGKTTSALLTGKRPIPPTKDRRDTPAFQAALAAYRERVGAFKEVRAAGWSPATTSWIEVVALLPERP